MSLQHAIQLPTDLDLQRAPHRGQLANLRVALILTEQALLAHFPPLRRVPFSAAKEPRTTILARTLLARGAELRALTDAYEQLCTAALEQDADDDIPF
jgi:hypothetical protein